jgi:DNA-binding NtrC family response regulator
MAGNLRGGESNMFSVIKDQETRTTGTESSALRVLLMSEDNADLETCKELMRSPGCRVQMCSNHDELLLHLEHEAFQLVIMFEAEKVPPEWQGVIKQAAEASGGTPVLVFKRSEELTSHSERLAS